MSTKIVFFKTKGYVIPRLIRFFTFSNWNHVGMVVDGDYYESEYGSGVTKNFDRYFHTSSEIETIVIDSSIDDEIIMKKFLEAQLGKKYDWTAIFGLPFRKNWQTKEKWFCSEIIAQSLINGKCLELPVSNKPYRITPRDLYMILASEKRQTI